MTNGDNPLYNNIHFYHSNYKSLPVASGEKACVDHYGPRYYEGTGQCCAKNSTGEYATLYNPFLGNIHWQTVQGRREYNIQCQEKP